MNKSKDLLPIIMRTILGAIFINSGTNNYLSFMPDHQYSKEGLAFITALKESGYLFDLIKSMEILGGTMLILNMFTPLVIIILAPIIVNIFLFELFLSSSYMLVPITLVVCEAYLFYEYRNLFRWLFSYQLHTHTNDEHPPEVLILDQLKEVNKKEYEHLKAVKGINSMILR